MKSSQKATKGTKKRLPSDEDLLKVKPLDSISFQQGFVCAVAVILREHGAHVEAEGALRNMQGVSKRLIDPFDWEMIEKFGLTGMFKS